MTAVGCARCSDRWDGHNTSHCSVCHETFTTARIFGSHRRAGKCLTPQEIGLVLSQSSYRCWATPMRPGFVHPSKSGSLFLPPTGNDPGQRGDTA